MDFDTNFNIVNNKTGINRTIDIRPVTYTESVYGWVVFIGFVRRGNKKNSSLHYEYSIQAAIAPFASTGYVPDAVFRKLMIN